MTVKLRFLYFYYVLETTFELAKMISSAEQQNFLHHYQSLQFDSKLETGTPSEKADVVRKVLASLHSAKVTGRWVLKTLLHVFREKKKNVHYHWSVSLRYGSGSRSLHIFSMRTTFVPS